MLAQSGADAVMVGRGAYGRPWLPNQIAHYLKTGERLADPPLAEQLEIVLSHFEDMLTHYGAEHGVRIARKHIAWYSKGLHGSAEYRAEINTLEDPTRVRQTIRSFYEPLLERIAA